MTSTLNSLFRTAIRRYPQNGGLSFRRMYVRIEYHGSSPPSTGRAMMQVDNVNSTDKLSNHPKLKKNAVRPTYGFICGILNRSFPQMSNTQMQPPLFSQSLFSMTRSRDRPLLSSDHFQRHEKRWKKRLRMKEESERRILVREINEAIEKQIDRW